MKTLIFYASKYGCTADCAAYLQTKLENATLVDVEKAPAQMDLSGFDTIIIGGAVYVSKVSKKLRAFCESNIDTLLKKRVGIFLCCALPEQFNEVLTANFPAALLNSSVVTKTFGSEARLAMMKFFDKMIIKAVSKGDFSKFQISYESMDEFVREIGG